jgi:hypothetical protein
MLKKDEEFKATEQAKLNSANKMIKFNADDFFLRNDSTKIILLFKHAKKKLFLI